MIARIISKFNLLIFFFAAMLLLFACNNRPEATAKNSQWLSHAIFYEIPIRNTTKENPLNFLKSNHIYHLSTMKINTLVLPPPQEIDGIEMNRLKETFYPICDFKSIDTNIGHPDSLYDFIRFIQDRNFKLLIEWPIYYTGICHEWVEKHPEYYAKKGVIKPSPTTKSLNLENRELWLAMLNEIKYWMTEYNIDGIVFQGWDKLSKEGQSYFYDEIKKINGIVVISDSQERNTNHIHADAELNYNLYQHIQSLQKGQDSLNKIIEYLVNDSQYDINDRPLQINFSSTLALNRKNGTYAVYLKRAYRGLTALVHSVKGLSWMLGGQEIPTSLALRPKNKRPIQWASKGHSDFFTALFAYKARNKSLWIDHKSELKILDTQADHILAFEHKYKGFKSAGIFNLSDNNQKLKFKDHLMNLNEHQTQRRIQFVRDSSYNLSAWQYIILGNE